jgi:hypothetical protein
MVQSNGCEGLILLMPGLPSGSGSISLLIFYLNTMLYINIKNYNDFTLMTKRLKKKHPKTRQSKPKKDDGHEQPEKQKDAFDFGGLPQRDLKKNLGCG